MPDLQGVTAVSGRHDGIESGQKRVPAAVNSG